MIIKFYLGDPESVSFKDQTPWKTIVPPSGIEPSEYFFEDPQCELNSEDDVAFYFEDDEPIFYKNQCDSSIEPIDVKAYWDC